MSEQKTAGASVCENMLFVDATGGVVTLRWTTEDLQGQAAHINGINIMWACAGLCGDNGLLCPDCVKKLQAERDTVQYDFDTCRVLDPETTDAWIKLKRYKQMWTKAMHEIEVAADVPRGVDNADDVLAWLEGIEKRVTEKGETK